MENPRFDYKQVNTPPISEDGLGRDDEQGGGRGEEAGALPSTLPGTRLTG